MNQGSDPAVIRRFGRSVQFLAVTTKWIWQVNDGAVIIVALLGSKPEVLRASRIWHDCIDPAHQFAEPPLHERKKLTLNLRDRFLDVVQNPVTVLANGLVSRSSCCALLSSDGIGLE